MCISLECLDAIEVKCMIVILMQVSFVLWLQVTFLGMVRRYAYCFGLMLCVLLRGEKVSCRALVCY